MNKFIKFGITLLIAASSNGVFAANVQHAIFTAKCVSNQSDEKVDFVFTNSSIQKRIWFGEKTFSSTDPINSIHKIDGNVYYYNHRVIDTNVISYISYSINFEYKFINQNSAKVDNNSYLIDSDSEQFNCDSIKEL